MKKSNFLQLEKSNIDVDVAFFFFKETLPGFYFQGQILPSDSCVLLLTAANNPSGLELSFVLLCAPCLFAC